VLETNPPTQEDVVEHHSVEWSYLLDSYSSYDVSKGLDHHLQVRARWVKRKVKVSEMMSGMPKLSRTLSCVGGVDDCSSLGSLPTCGWSGS
jgi:hypothetical protein